MLRREKSSASAWNRQGIPRGKHVWWLKGSVGKDCISTRNVLDKYLPMQRHPEPDHQSNHSSEVCLPPCAALAFNRNNRILCADIFCLWYLLQPNWRPTRQPLPRGAEKNLMQQSPSCLPRCHHAAPRSWNRPLKVRMIRKFASRLGY